jgi:hypothetical protein
MKWYDPRTLTDGFFRSPSAQTYANHCTGKALSAAPLSGFFSRSTFTLVLDLRFSKRRPQVHRRKLSNRNIWFDLGPRRSTTVFTDSQQNTDYVILEFKLVLNLRDAERLASVHELGGKQFHRLVVHHDHTILSYSLDVLGRVVTGQAQASTLDATMERVAGKDSNVLFVRVAEIGQRLLGVCCRASLVKFGRRCFFVLSHVCLQAAIASQPVSPCPRSRRCFWGNWQAIPKTGDVPSFRRGMRQLFSSNFCLMLPINQAWLRTQRCQRHFPASKERRNRDAGWNSHLRSYEVCFSFLLSSSQINYSMSAYSFAKSTISVVPDLRSSNDPAITLLKDRIAEAKPLGLIRVTPDELMVVYDSEFMSLFTCVI